MSPLMEKLSGELQDRGLMAELASHWLLLCGALFSPA